MPIRGRVSRRAVALFALLLLGAASGYNVAHPAEAVTQALRPNILLIVSDDQSTSLFNRDLNPSVFSELVDKGVLFNRFYVNTALCCPSRSQMLTGLYEHHTGVDENTVPLDRPTIAQAVHDLGYRTILAGKYLNSWPCTPRSEFDQWVCETGEASYVNPTLNVNGVKTQFTGIASQIEANFASQFIANTPPNQPFFVMYTPRSPHLPADDPRYDSMPVDPFRPPNYDQETRTGRMPMYTETGPLSPAKAAEIDTAHMNMAQSTRALDDDVASVLASLGSREQDTLVFYVSDNGQFFGEHRQFGKIAPYEESVKVPLVIRFPELVPESSPWTTDALVQNVDIAPTIADLVGIHWGADGTSLVPLLEQQVTSVRTEALIENCEGVSYPCYGQIGAPGYFGVVTSQYKYVEYDTNEKELYDLVNDPYELVNLAGDPSYAGVQQQLAADLLLLRGPPPIDTTIVTGPMGVVQSRAFGLRYFSQSRFAHYQCRLDVEGVPGPWQNCDVQPYLIGPLADGNYAVEVKGTDENGATDPTPDIRSFSLQQSGPDVQITAAPPLDSINQSGSFSFQGGGDVVAYQCSLVPFGSPPKWGPCAPPTFTFSNLFYAPWDFRVMGQNGTGAWTTPPAEYVFEVDNRGPTVLFDAAPDAKTQSTDASFAFHPDQPASAMTCKVDGGPANDCISGSLTLQGLAVGTHTLVVTATDMIGLTAQTNALWVVDQTAPTFSITKKPDAFSNHDFGSFVLSPKAGLTYTCSIDGGATIICPSNPTFYGLVDGSHSVTFTALDGAGNESPPQIVGWTQDTVVPIVSIDSGPPLYSPSRSATFNFSATDQTAVTLVCSLDGGRAKSCSSPVTRNNLADGTHSFVVTGRDKAGNTATATWTWTVDLTAPNTTITSGPNNHTNDTSATFEFAANEAVGSYTCSLDGGAPQTCSSPATYDGLTPGSHTFSVFATDLAGNMGPPAEWDWTING